MGRRKEGITRQAERRRTDPDWTLELRLVPSSREPFFAARQVMESHGCKRNNGLPWSAVTSLAGRLRELAAKCYRLTFFPL